MRCLVLDGQHAGHLFCFHKYPPRIIKIPNGVKKKTATLQIDEVPATKELDDFLEYRLAAQGNDLWLYSTDGNLMSLISSKEWVCPFNGTPEDIWLYYAKQKEIYHHPKSDIAI